MYIIQPRFKNNGVGGRNEIGSSLEKKKYKRKFSKNFLQTQVDHIWKDENLIANRIGV
jgi:hypothetical protein